MTMEEKTEIEIRCLSGIHRVRARIIGHLAVHQELLANGLLGMSYTITHVPSGIAMGPSFGCEDDAIAAAVELGLLCDWLAFDPKRITTAFRKSVSDILRRHGGVPSDDVDRPLRERRARAEFDATLNGYKASPRDDEAQP